MLRNSILSLSLVVLIISAYLVPDDGTGYVHGHTTKIVSKTEHNITGHHCADHKNHPNLPNTPHCSYCARNVNTTNAITLQSSFNGEALTPNSTIIDSGNFIHSQEITLISGSRAPPQHQL